MPEISVIVPLYNAEKYIFQCLDSILKQSFYDIEVIVVDDGSSDKGRDICEKIAQQDDRVIVIHQNNQGAIRARYTGICHSSAKYITFVDADDFINEEAYIYAEAAMKKDIDAIFFEISRYYNEKKQKVEKKNILAGVYEREDLERTVFPQLIWNVQKNIPGVEPSLCVAIIKKEIVIQQYKRIINESFQYGEDIAILYPLYIKFKKVEYIDKCYYQHRQRRQEIAPYLKDENYFKGLYRLYRYLMEEFSEDNEYFNWKKQIDYFFIYSAEKRKEIYNDKRKTSNYLFPFNRVDSGKTIVLYGAGNVGQIYYEQLTKLNYCKEIIWVDKKYDNMENPNVKNPELIRKSYYDVVVVAIDNKIICEQVKEYLQDMGVSEEKIVCEGDV